MAFSAAFVTTGLLLLVVVRCQRVPCQRFQPDVSSKAYLAPLVFRGRLLRLDANRTERIAATFRVQRIFKMDEHVQLDKRQDVVVDFVRRTARAKNAACVPAVSEQDLKLRQRYLVFASRSGTTAGPVNFTAFATPEVHSRRSSRAIKKVLCRQCARSPTVSGLSDVKLEVRQRLRLKCKLSGRPSPWVEWYRDGKRIRGKGRIRIRTKKKHSKLEIKRVKLSDSGEYECRASNVVRREPVVARAKITVTRSSSSSSSSTSSSKEQQRPYSPQPTNDSTLWPLKGRPCPHTPSVEFCLNGGSCTFYEAVGEYVCHCAEGYVGLRCDYKDVTIVLGKIKSNAQKALRPR